MNNSYLQWIKEKNEVKIIVNYSNEVFLYYYK